ncbi:MAG: hypothetical protein JSV04_02775 [Candidatus Heimdallarchaeota archaeon]|nr:MAG: hypothetical protein JSV04_02775 [Candidatus Heimdallarchaeota archaeon]
MEKIKNPSVLAAMAGITDGDFAQFCLKRGGAGMVTIGGYPVGREMIQASIKIAQRGRKEFILQSGNESRDLLREANKIKDVSSLIINLRLNQSKEAKKLAQEFTEIITEKPIIEINAHCRQVEITEEGGGQSLLYRSKVLNDIIRNFHSRDFRISLKIRGNAISPDVFSHQVCQWPLDFLHIDSYQVGRKGTDLDLLTKYTQILDISIIGNNSVTDFQSAKAILNTGARFFSIARAAQKNPSIFYSLVKHF